MNKISVWNLARRHWTSVLSRDDGKLPFSEVVIFIVLPIVVGILFSRDVASVSEGFHAALISCYSIFSALLLSVQMALFGIFQRQIAQKSQKDSMVEKGRIEARVDLIRELNANVAFLVLISIVAAAFSLVFLGLKMPEELEVFLSFFFVSLFLVNILLVIRRAYILFDVEYSNDDGGDGVADR